MRIRSAVFCGGLGAMFLGLGMLGCSDDETAPADGTPEAGGGGSTGTGGAKTGGASNTGGAKTGGAPSTGGANTGGAGGANTGGANTGGTDGGTDGGPDGSDGGYKAPTPPLPTPVGYVAGGNFAPLGAYAGDAGSGKGITGHAQIIRTADGKTTVQLHVEGLTAATAYGAHVHSLPCNVDNAGGHYKIDPSIATADQANEIWPGPFTTDADGVGRASVQVDHAARPDAQSVVIHDTANGNAKMACADLLPEPVATTTSRGTFAPFAAATAADKNIGGTATLVRSSTGTEVTLAATGLAAAGMYMAHVHAFPCAVTSAGGHYKIDPTNTATVESNEIWPVFGDGGSATVSVSHIARPDAQSVVLHRSDLGTPAPKVACADLVRVEAYDPYKTEGTATLFAAAGTHGVGSMTASGTMSRTVAPQTTATVSVTGLLASTAYGIHVHDHTCGLLSGGGHYKIDPTITTAQQSNEIWLNLTTDGAGAGTQTLSVSHLARPEGGSIVIHDPDTSRLACIDLL
jgi:superoxide dismutase, Cu-Zn family